MLQLGAIFPQTEIGAGREGVRDYAQAADELGFDYLVVYDHVLGADSSRHELRSRGRPAGYTYETMFHEPLVLFGYLAGVTEDIRFLTGVIILPQRQTALVAKQAAEIDILSGGRLILGVGTGWNHVEYASLGKDFRTRGRRQEEQIGLLRRLWTEPLVDFDGEFDRIQGAGLNPLLERPIPIWLGGWTDVVFDRIGRVGDGWLSVQSARATFGESVGKIQAAARAAGREPSQLSIGAAVGTGGFDPEQQVERVLELERLGATHCAIDTMNAGFTSAQQHIDAIRAFREAYVVAAG